MRKSEKDFRFLAGFPVRSPVEAPAARGMTPRDRKKRKRKKEVPGGFFSISCTICTKIKGQLWAVPILEKRTFFFYTSFRKKVSFPAGSVLLPGFWEKESTTDECV